MTNLNSFENFSAETSIKSKHLESLDKIKHRKSSFDGRKNCETVDKVSLNKKKKKLRIPEESDLVIGNSTKSGSISHYGLFRGKCNNWCLWRELFP